MTIPSAGILNYRNWSLKTRIALFTLAIFVASFWALALYVGQLLQRDMQQLLTEQQFASVSLVAAQVNGDVEERMNSLQMIARSYTPTSLADRVALQADLERRAVLKRLFNRGIFVTDASGTAIASSPVSAGRTGLNFMDKEHVVTALKQGKANISRPTIGKTLGAPVIVMAVPIRDAQDKVIGAFMGVTDLGAPNFLDKVADNRFGKTGGYVLVTPKYRQVITAGDKRRMMEILPPPGKIPLIDRFIEGYEGSGILINPLGVEVLAAAKAVPSASWYVGVFLPTEEAFAPVAALKTRLLLAALLLTLVVGLLTWWMVQRQLEPMLTAIDTLKNLPGAELPIRALPVKRLDEVGQLITSFNHLMGVLAEREAASREAQNLLGRIASRVPGMVYQFRLRADGTSSFPYASAGIRDIYRVEPEEVREDASKVFAILHPADYDAVASSIQFSAERLALWRHEYRVKFADGVVRWLRGEAMPHREEDGSTIWDGFITDITDRKEATDALLASERRFSTLLQNLPAVAVQGYTSDGKLHYWNAASEQVYGYTEIEAKGRYIQDLLFPEESAPGYVEALKQMAETGQPLPPTEVALRHKDGSILQIYASHATVKIPGSPVEIYCFDVDLTERKRMEKDLAASELSLKMAMRGGDLGLWDYNLTADDLRVNDRWLTMLGLDPKGKPPTMAFCRTLIFDEDLPKYEAAIQSVVAGQQTEFELEVRIRHQEGHLVWAQKNGGVVERDRDGKPTRIAGTLKDISVRKRAELEAHAEWDFATQIVNAMGQGLSVTSTKGVLEFANPALATLLGYKPGELIGKGRNEIFFEEDAARQPQILADREKGKSSTYDAMFRRRDGTPVPVQVTGVPRFVDGKYTGSIAVITDMSDRVRVEQALQDSEQRFRMLIELSPEASIVHCAGLIVYANPAALNMYGAASVDGLVGRNIMDFVHPDSRAEVSARVEALAAGASVLPVAKLKNIRLDGAVIDIESQSVATVFDGKPAARLSIRDVTARNRADAERASLEAQLRESQKMQAIGTLAGGIAHDFNNILAAILGNTELAREDSAGNKRALESIEEIRKAAARARDLVQQILSFSRRQPTERKAIKLDAVVEEARRLLRATLPMRLSLDVHCEKEVPEVLADATQIQQAIINLVTNAMQAMPSGAGRIEIRLDTVALSQALISAQPKLQSLAKRHPGHAIRLTVRDTGPGIPADIVARIFEPFFTTKPVNEGTGLGLSVVHGIVDAHEGVIDVTSTIGVGTAFEIYLPMATVGAVFKPSVLPTITGGNLAIKKATGLRILYLDDDEAMVFLTSRLLGRKGFRVSPFSNQQDALDALRATPNAFDVVVTDYNMPGMSGIEVATEVRTIRGDLPVIIASGFVDEELQAKAVDAGVKSLVFKETIVDEFVNAIAKAAEAA